MWVMDTTCTENAVSLTPLANRNFGTTSNSENHRQNGFGMHKKLKMHAVSLTVPLFDASFIFDARKTYMRRFV
jgi:hypothetical protein